MTGTLRSRALALALVSVLVAPAALASHDGDPEEREQERVFRTIFGPPTWHGNAPIPPGDGVAFFEDLIFEDGYRIFTDNGDVYAFGDAAWHGNLPGGVLQPGERVITGGDTFSGAADGYTIVTSRGQVFNFGDANCPTFDSNLLVPGDEIVDAVLTVNLAAAPPRRDTMDDGSDLPCAIYLVSRLGHVYALGGVAWCGSVPDIVGETVDFTLDIDFFFQDECGYTITTSAGAVYAFGTAPWFGSIDPAHLGGQRVVSFTEVFGIEGVTGHVLWTDRGNSYVFGKGNWPGNMPPLAQGEHVLEVHAVAFQGFLAFTNLGRVDGLDGGDDDGELTPEMRGSQQVADVAVTPADGYFMVTDAGNVYGFDQRELFLFPVGSEASVRAAAAQAAGTTVPPELWRR